MTAFLVRLHELVAAATGGDRLKARRRDRLDRLWFAGLPWALAADLVELVDRIGLEVPAVATAIEREALVALRAALPNIVAADAATEAAEEVAKISSRPSRGRAPTRAPQRPRSRAGRPRPARRRRPG
ncbi:MAG: hypothetical protein R3B09_32360 [Nannocystaceae bacterium]